MIKNSLITIVSRIAVALGVLLASTAVRAQISCTILDGSNIVQVGPINAPANAPVGAVLAEVAATVRLSCAAADPGYEGVLYLSEEPVGDVWPLMNNIGLQIILADGTVAPNGSGAWQRIASYDEAASISPNGIVLAKGRYRLIKLGNVEGSEWWIRYLGWFGVGTRNPGAGNPEWSPPTNTVAGRIEIHVSGVVIPSCTIRTPNIAVPMPDVRSSALASPGSTAGSKAFSIGLQCAEGMAVHMTLTDNTDPGNTSDQLTLAKDSTADGAKLQILHNGAPVSFGPDSSEAGNPGQWYVGQSDTLTNIPLTARYINAGAGPVKAGSVRAVATFTMSYQ